MLGKHIAHESGDYHLGAILFHVGCALAQYIRTIEAAGWIAAAAGARQIALTDAAAAGLADAETEAYLRRQDDLSSLAIDWRYPDHDDL